MTAVGSFFGRLIDALRTSGVAHMVSGSFASTYYGIPRTTQDIDIVVDFSPASLRRFLAQLPEDEYYVSTDAAQEAVRVRGQFNVIDFESGWKVDLIQRKARTFSVTEFERRTTAELLGLDVHIATAEDVVLSKLEWAKKAGSDRQLRDVVGVLEVSGRGMDIPYIEGWLDVLGVDEFWEQARAAVPATIWTNGKGTESD